MKKIILPAIIALFIIATCITSSCTKDIYEPTIVKDSIVYKTIKDTIRITNNDTVKIIIGQDSVKFNFSYTINYNSDSTSLVLSAVDSSENVPVNAVYTWALNGNSTSLPNGKRYWGGQFTGTANNGNDLLSMSVDLPSSSVVYSVVKKITINIK